MKHYRRKPLQLIDQGLPESVTGLLEQVETLPTTVSESGGLAADPKALTEPVTQIIPPMAGGAETIPTPETLVQQAATILDNDLSTPLESAQTVASPLDLGTTTPPRPNSYSVPGLVDEMHGFVNELANLLSLKSNLPGSISESTPSSEAGVPLLQPAHPSHAGETVQISFKVHNDRLEPTQTKVFCTDLHSCQGDLIAQDAISITPNPLSLAPETNRVHSYFHSTPPESSQRRVFRNFNGNGIVLPKSDDFGSSDLTNVVSLREGEGKR